MNLKAKILRNKCNNQLMIVLSRRKLKDILKKRNPKFIYMENVNFDFLEDENGR